MILPSTVNAECEGFYPQKRCRDEYDPNAKVYYKTSCCLTEVPRDIPAQAQRVNLWDNRINFLPAGIFEDLSQCVSLELQQNSLSSFDKDAFAGLLSLERLSFENNYIYHIEPGTFQYLSQCKQLYLNSNSLTTFGLNAGMFQGLFGCEKLDLSFNKLTSIPAGLFQDLPSCTKLDLDHNEIRFLNRDTFMGLTNLEELYLHSNEIRKLDPSLFATQFALRHITLYGNILTTLSSATFENLPRPLELSLQGNPWNCSSLCWVKHEEQHGTINWLKEVYHTRCTEGGGWRSLGCSDKGEKKTHFHWQWK